MRDKLASAYGWVLLNLAMSLVNGCGLWPAPTPAETIRTFLFQTEELSSRQGKDSSQRRAGTLLVTLPTAQPGHTTPQMAYVRHDHELQYFALNQWADTPARMLQPLLVNMAEQTNLWHQVVQTPSAARGDFQISGDQLLVQQEFTGSPSQVRLHLRVQLMRLHDYQVVATRAFTVVEKTPSDDPAGGVQATNIAVSALLTQIADWLVLCMSDPSTHRC